MIAQLITANISSTQYIFLLMSPAGFLPPFSLEGGLKLAPSSFSVYLELNSTDRTFSNDNILGRLVLTPNTVLVTLFFGRELRCPTIFSTCVGAAGGVVQLDTISRIFTSTCKCSIQEVAGMCQGPRSETKADIQHAQKPALRFSEIAKNL